MLDLERRREELEVKLFEMSQGMQAERDRTARRTDRFFKVATVFFVIVGIAEAVGVLAAITSLAYPDGWPWLMKLLGN